MQRKRQSRRQSGFASPTLDDVARLAQVSTATVSRCLNTPERVVEDTRERVLKVVKDIGYAPNFGARALAAKRTNTIGAIIPTMENAIFARGLQAFQEQLADHGLTLLVASSSYSPDLEEEQIRTLLARGADALLLIGFQRDPSVYEYLEKRGVPFVISWAYSERGHYPSVGFDNRLATRQLAKKAIEMGHRDLAIITAPREPNDRARERVAGILDAAAAAGLEHDAIPIIETPYAIENGHTAMIELMRLDHRPSVVLCGNDVLAIGAVQAAKELGLSVPADVSVTGCDDIEIAQIVDPGLTTVHVPHRRMGSEAANLIAAMLGGSAIPDSQKFGTDVVLRESLAPK